MDTLRKLLLALGAASLAVVLAAGPVSATEAGDDATTTETSEEGDHGGGVIQTNDEGKMVLPLDPERPRDAVGWGLIAITALAIVAGLVNATKQLRGERPQATGEWRYR